ncbi:hypothetical protein [Brevibacillus borstelensis]|uniref:hypothetical protein n=1 Tax=Brevibacillus borstelensis TaxID=45462 RepID=UPI002E202DFF|nr:hypothetical protein [Brevibacillus borstelensis]
MDMSGTFWILVVLGIIAAVIANLAYMSGRTIMTMAAIGMGGVGGWFVEGVLGMLLGLLVLLDKLSAKFNKWLNTNSAFYCSYQFVTRYGESHHTPFINQIYGNRTLEKFKVPQFRCTLYMILGGY